MVNELYTTEQLKVLSRLKRMTFEGAHTSLNFLENRYGPFRRVLDLENMAGIGKIR